jgi:hypothetical protein
MQRGQYPGVPISRKDTTMTGFMGSSLLVESSDLDSSARSLRNAAAIVVQGKMFRVVQRDVHHRHLSGVEHSAQFTHTNS